MKLKLMTITTMLIFMVGLDSHIIMANEQDEIREQLSDMMLDFIAQGKVDSDNLVNCANENYKPSASHRSLASWSKSHHQEAEQAIKVLQKKPADSNAGFAAGRACTSALKMRGAAHCLKPNNLEYQMALAESFDICKEYAL
ncbi:MAG: hypothetical protein KUG78_01355 [Kangiellaceae bacterium]|nr:hypothetical protein [Kangiellaceae bacterium]